MLTLTAREHLKTVKYRLENHQIGNITEYNDCAVVALHYSIHANSEQDRIEACAIYDAVVTQRAERFVQSK